MIRGIVIAAFLFLLAGSAPLRAEDAVPPPVPPPAERPSTLIPIPVLFYTPETGLAYGLSALYAFGGLPQQPERVSGVVIHTQEDQLVSSVQTGLLPGGGRFELEAGVSFRRFPGDFYGVGNERPDDAVESYTPVEFRADAMLLRRWESGLRLGGRVAAADFEIRRYENGGIFDVDPPVGSAGGWTVGGGPVGAWDTRDRFLEPAAGELLRWEVLGYHDAMGSEYEFVRLNLDLRKYARVSHGWTIAARLVGEAASGEIPFLEMPFLGGSELLRGAYEGRYRDRSMVAAQSETRFRVSRRFGLVAFLETGQVAPDWGAVSARAFHFSGGGGLRLFLAPERGLVLRVDYGVSGSQSGFYFGLGDAF